MRKGINKRGLILTILLLLLIVPTVVFSAEVKEEWAVIHNGGEGDNLYGMTKDAQGNVYIGGSSDRIPAITKIDSAGNVAWSVKYDDTYYGNFYEIAADSFGNVYGVGVSRDASYQYQLTIVKYDVSGTLKWVRKYGPGYATAANIDDSGNIYVGGYLSYQGYVMIKYDASGNVLWASTPLFNRNYSYPGNIAFDSAGDAYLAAGNAVIKYDATSGEALWVQEGVAGSSCPGIGVDPQDNVYVSGASKLDSSGTLLWTISAKSGVSTCPSNNWLAVDASGNVYMTGGSDDFKTVKYDTNGNLIWVRLYDGGTGGRDKAFDLKMDEAGNVVVAGSGEDGVTGEDYIATVKYDPNGNQLWAAQYTKPGNWLYAPMLEVGGEGSVYVAGYTGYMGVNDWDNIIIKYSEGPSSISDISEIVGEMLGDGRITNPGIANALTQLLSNAEASLDNGNTVGAVNMLEAAINLIEAQSGGKIETTAANDLIGYLSDMIAEL